MAATAGGVYSACLRAAASDVELVARCVRVRQRRGYPSSASAALTTSGASVSALLQLLSDPPPSTLPLVTSHINFSWCRAKTKSYGRTGERFIISLVPFHLRQSCVGISRMGND